MHDCAKDIKTQVNCAAINNELHGSLKHVLYLLMAILCY